MRARLHLRSATAFDVALAGAFGLVALAVFLAAGGPGLAPWRRTPVETVHRAASGLGWRSEYLIGLVGGLVAIALLVAGAIVIGVLVVRLRQRA